MLHRVRDWSDGGGGHSSAFVAQCLDYIADRGYKVISLSELCNSLDTGKLVNERFVVFTIDDGFADQAHLAENVFSPRNVPLNFFVATGFIDGAIWLWDDQVEHVLANTESRRTSLPLPNGAEFRLDGTEHWNTAVDKLRDELKSMDQGGLYDWLPHLFSALEVEVEYPGDVPNRYRPMTWKTVRELSAAGHEFYPHTVTHRILSRLSPQEQETEITKSVARLSENVPVSAKAFAYPTGRDTDYSSDTVDTLRSLGLRYAFSTEAGYVSKKSSAFELPRFSLPKNFLDFRQYLTGIEAVKDWARDRF